MTPNTGQEQENEAQRKPSARGVRGSRMVMTQEEYDALVLRRGTAVPGHSSVFAALPAMPSLIIVLALLIYGVAHLDAVRLWARQTLRTAFAAPQPVPEATVWVVPATGNFYCRGSQLYGRSPGRPARQADALTAGYQPALGVLCPTDPPAERAAVGVGDAPARRLANR